MHSAKSIGYCQNRLLNRDRQVFPEAGQFFQVRVFVDGLENLFSNLPGDSGMVCRSGVQPRRQPAKIIQRIMGIVNDLRFFRVGLSIRWLRVRVPSGSLKGLLSVSGNKPFFMRRGNSRSLRDLLLCSSTNFSLAVAPGLGCKTPLTLPCILASSPPDPPGAQ
uniref:Uncharacterized protein n=1 Tax=Rubinisphaera brasiliensis (strain ATCC 49424 / DSM 5305 / JCM 21570 / IAM 15109 / NBRC 103401 / IFAM 1448) TaxID=756272 RepID=F0SL91_RUBBR|nr:hypothetical protein Plabr_4425 [Rubinisphaera brasiliensis DSM 5305]